MKEAKCIYTSKIENTYIFSNEGDEWISMFSNGLITTIPFKGLKRPNIGDMLTCYNSIDQFGHLIKLEINGELYFENKEFNKHVGYFPSSEEEKIKTEKKLREKGLIYP